MSNAGSSSIGASPKYLEIDLTYTDPPFTFEAVFRAAYPSTGHRAFTSRTIVALDAGVLTVVDTEGAHVPLTFAAGEANGIQATGIHATTDITSIKVLL